MLPVLLHYRSRYVYPERSPPHLTGDSDNEQGSGLSCLPMGDSFCRQASLLPWGTMIKARLQVQQQWVGAGAELFVALHATANAIHKPGGCGSSTAIHPLRAGEE